MSSARAEIIVLLLAFILHEWGHILLMKEFEIYKGMKFHWWGSECLVDREAIVQINLAGGILLYMIGFIFGLIPLPIWCFIGSPASRFIILQIILSGIDFFYCAKMLFKVISFNENEGMKNA